MANVSDQTKIEAWARQDGVCALCGDTLEDTLYEAHHMRRVADGGTNEVDNIVMLCSKDDHLHAHGGNFCDAVETEPDAYPFFNGPSEELKYQQEEDLQEVNAVENPISDQETLLTEEPIDEGGIG